MNRAPRILVTRLRYLGDVILSTPLVRQLREALPEARIDYLVEDGFAPVLEGCDLLDQVHVLPSGASWPQTLRIVRRLREADYDWALDLLGNPRSALLCLLSGARRRVGSRRGLRSRFYHHRRDRPAGDPSAVLHHLDKATPLWDELGLRPARPAAAEARTMLWVSDSERDTARKLVGPEDPSDIVLVHPGSKWPDKAWPRERWPELIRSLRSRHGGRVFVVSPPGESKTAQWVAEQSDGVRRLPEMGLRELFALLDEVRLYVGNDGGVLHASVALGTPTVGLFGPTDPAIWFPYEQLGPFRVVHDCGPAQRDASGQPASRLEGVEVSKVLDAIDAALAEGDS